jgi:hypothetical protein
MRRAPLLLLLLSSGCAATLSGFQPAHVARKGHVTAEAGWDVSIPTGTISRAFDAGETLAKAARSRSLNDSERRQVIEAGANVAIDPPTVVGHLGVAFVPLDRFELGLRWSYGAWRGGFRYQLLTQERHGLDLTAGLGVSRFSYEYPIDKVIDVIKLDDFTRWSLDVPLLVGKHASWYRLWGGPRLIFSRFDTAMTLHLPATGSTPEEIVAASVGGNATFIGGQAGFALGYRYLFLGLELTIVRLISHAHLDLAGQRQDVDLSGMIIYPGIALMGEF